MMPANVLVGKVGDLFWLRVEGKGCFQNSVHVKQAVKAVVKSGTKNVVVDLERCPTMDSTFLGILTCAAVDLKRAGDGNLTVLNLNERNQQLLTSLGLDHVLHMDADGTSWAEERRLAAQALALCEEQTDCCKTEQAAHVLQAHKALASTSAENECRFRDVIEFLEKELAQKKA
jgi:anti-anti-sigma factor